MLSDFYFYFENEVIDHERRAKWLRVSGPNLLMRKLRRGQCPQSRATISASFDIVYVLFTCCRPCVLQAHEPNVATVVGVYNK